MTATPDDVHNFDFLVIGSGIAGLFYALRVADHGSVGLVTKRQGGDSATNWAQGGLAEELGPDDSFDAHVEDTLRAGAGLVQKAAVPIWERLPKVHRREAGVEQRHPVTRGNFEPALRLGLRLAQLDQRSRAPGNFDIEPQAQELMVRQAGELEF